MWWMPNISLYPPSLVILVIFLVADPVADGAPVLVPVSATELISTHVPVFVLCGVCVCVCVSIKLLSTAQSSPVILVIICHSH